MDRIVSHATHYDSKGSAGRTIKERWLWPGDGVGAYGRLQIGPTAGYRGRAYCHQTPHFLEYAMLLVLATILGVILGGSAGFIVIGSLAAIE